MPNRLNHPRDKKNRNRRNDKDGPRKPGKRNKPKGRNKPRSQSSSRSRSSLMPSYQSYAPPSMDYSSIAQNDIDNSMDGVNGVYAKEQLGIDNSLSNYAASAGAIYDGLQAELKPITPQFLTQNQQIADGFTQNMGAFSDQYMAGNQEGAMAGDVFGSIGAGTLGVLASDAGRQNAYGASTQTQGALQRTEALNAAEAIRQQKQDELRAWYLEQAPDPEDYRSKMEQLRADQWDREMEAKRFAAERSDARYGRQGDRQDARAQKMLADFLAEQARTQAMKKKDKKKKKGKKKIDDKPKRPARPILEIVERRKKEAERIASTGSKVGRVGGHTTRTTGTGDALSSSRISRIPMPSVKGEKVVNDDLLSYAKTAQNLGESPESAFADLKARGIKFIVQGQFTVPLTLSAVRDFFDDTGML